MLVCYQCEAFLMWAAACHCESFKVFRVLGGGFLNDVKVVVFQEQIQDITGASRFGEQRAT